MKECKNKGISKLERCAKCDGLGHYIVGKNDNKPEYVGFLSTCEMYEIEKPLDFKKDEIKYNWLMD